MTANLIEPPPAPRSRQKASTAATDAKRRRILQAAEQLFASQGYARTTLLQIVRVLGVSKPFVYYYFHSKQDIFETLSWQPTVACFSSMDFARDDPRSADVKIRIGLERLIGATIKYYPAAFFPYREPQAYRAQYRQAQHQLAGRFYDNFCALLEQAKADGKLVFSETRITAQAACSLPGFLYTWYRPDGRLGPAAMVRELSQLAWRLIGLGEPAQT